MIILGIDPGLALVGYSVLEIVGNKTKLLEYGVIKTTPKYKTQERFKIIYDKLEEIIKQYKPEEMAIEELFFNKNTKTVISVAGARGVEILCGVNNGLKIYEYTPLQIKNSIVGYGRAEKNQVQLAVKMCLSLSEIPKPDDAADAIAIALTHSFSGRFKDQFEMK